MNKYIKNVKHDTWVRKSEINSEYDKQFNRIIVTFHGAEQKGWHIFIDKVALKNERDEELAQDNCPPNGRFYGITTISPLHLCFEMDKCELLDGAKFEIWLRESGTSNRQHFIYLLSNGVWNEKKKV